MVILQYHQYQLFPFSPCINNVFIIKTLTSITFDMPTVLVTKQMELVILSIVRSFNCR